MRTLAAVLALLLCAVPAHAVDIKGKWGIGAGVFDSGARQVSLIRGHSERTAWGLDLNADQSENRGQGGGVIDLASVGIGPRLRRYTRPADDFSPYWDAWISGLYNRDHMSSVEEWSAGLAGGFDFGAEYFTRWHFSLAMHSGLLSGSWQERHFKARSSLYGSIATVTHTQTASLGLSPGVVLRAYF